MARGAQARTPGTVAASEHRRLRQYQAAGCATLDRSCRPPSSSERRGPRRLPRPYPAALRAACRGRRIAERARLGRACISARRRMLCHRVPGRDSRPHRPPGIQREQSATMFERCHCWHGRRRPGDSLPSSGTMNRELHDLGTVAGIRLQRQISCPVPTICSPCQATSDSRGWPAER